MGARGPKPTTGEKINLRVAQGSALERLLAGRSITETIHRMAELIEAAPASVAAELPVVNMMLVDMTVAEQRVAALMAQGDALTPEAPGPGRYSASFEPQYVTIGHGRDQKTVTRAEALALVAEQSAGSLVPVGIDTGDEFDNEEVVEIEPWDGHDDVNPRRFDNDPVVEPEQASLADEHPDLSHLI